MPTSALESLTLPVDDHAFHVRMISGSNDAQVREAMLDAMVAWMVTGGSFG